MADNPKALDTFPGARYWRSMQGAVDAILTPMGITRPVISKGTKFVNYDAWTGEDFAHKLCEFLSRHPDRMPNMDELGKLLETVNRLRQPNPYICVARMPARVTVRVAHAIIGGGYHEAFHTKYSKRGRVRLSEVMPILEVGQPIFDEGGTFSAKMRGLLMTLHHLIEDIRIERRGLEYFEGARQPMVDLQDFILELEEKSRERGAKVKNVTVSMNSRSLLLCAFRDVGLGYNTSRAQKTIQFYKEHAPDAIAMIAPGGPLAPMLYEAQNLSETDLMGSLRVAMKTVVELWRLTQQDLEDEESPKTKCPCCGASAKNLVIRSVRNDKGIKIKGRAEMECKVCGFKTEFDLPDNSLNLNQQQKERDEDEEAPEVEDLTQDDVGEGSDGFGDDDREHARDQEPQEQQDSEGSGDDSDDSDDEGAQTIAKSKPKKDEKSEDESEGGGSEGDDSDEGSSSEEDEGEAGEDESGEGDGSEAEEGEEEADGESSGSGAERDGDEEEEGESEDEGDEEGDSASGSGDETSEADEDLEDDVDGNDHSEREGEGGENREGDDADTEDGDSDGAPDGEGGDEGEGSETSDGEPEEGPNDSESGDWEMDGETFEQGGGHLDLGRDGGGDQEQAAQVLDGDENDGRITNRDAIEDALEDQRVKDAEDLKADERVWNPYNPMLDEVHMVSHTDEDINTANEMLEEVREPVAFLGNRLRAIVLAQEMRDTVHGVRRGRRLSSRTLVDTATSVRNGRMPKRAYQVTDEKIDTSIDLAVVLDQSMSMAKMKRDVAKIMMILTESVESIHGGTFVCGFRNGVRAPETPSDWHEDWHRVHGVRYDVFKTWDEKFMSTKARFAHTAAKGSTPMSDGIEFALTAIDGRQAGHRIVAVVTDGAPDWPHEPIIKRQIRIARDAGVQLIGVGITNNARYVVDLFGPQNAVWTETVEEMPYELLRKLNELCDFTGRYRGRRMNTDSGGKIGRKVS